MLNPGLIYEGIPWLGLSPSEQSRDQRAGQGARRDSPSLFTAPFWLSRYSCSRVWGIPSLLGRPEVV